ncbi:MAG TPA: hypothetical protein O0X39_07070 [Methanocorpusculum sp.]|nr:hypothetical protein [Methanocorpusculum sp.]
MTGKKAPAVQHFRMDDTLAGDLDKRITRMGYRSRSEYFTAVAFITLYGKTAEDSVPDEVCDWIEAGKPPLSEFEIRQNLLEMIHIMLMPVIAMKGQKIAFAKTWQALREEFHRIHEMWLTESDIREAVDIYALIHRKELDDYRNKTLNEEQK